MNEILSVQFVYGLLVIILIDIVLGGENAIVIAMASKRLPPDLRKQAMIWGTLGAVAVRFACVAALTYLLMIPGLKIVGGLMLIYIGWKLTQGSSDHSNIKAVGTFWGALGTIIMADAVMGVDNALAIAGAANGSWTLIVLGLLISVPIILFSASLVSRYLERYPSLIYLGSFVLYYVAGKMIVHEPFIDNQLDPLHDFIENFLPVIGAVVITAKQYYRTEIRKQN